MPDTGIEPRAHFNALTLRSPTHDTDQAQTLEQHPNGQQQHCDPNISLRPTNAATQTPAEHSPDSPLVSPQEASPNSDSEFASPLPAPSPAPSESQDSNGQHQRWQQHDDPAPAPDQSQSGDDSRQQTLRARDSPQSNERSDSPLLQHVNPLHRQHRSTNDSQLKPSRLASNQPPAPPPPLLDQRQQSPRHHLQLQSQPVTNTNQLISASHSIVSCQDSTGQLQDQSQFILQLQNQLNCQRTQIAAQNAIIHLQEQSMSQRTTIPMQSLAMWRAAIQHCTTKSHALQQQLDNSTQLYQQELSKLRQQIEQQEQHADQLLKQQRLASQAELAAARAEAAAQAHQHLTQLRTDHAAAIIAHRSASAHQISQLRSVVQSLARQCDQQQSTMQQDFEIQVESRLNSQSQRLSFVAQRCAVLLALQTEQRRAHEMQQRLMNRSSIGRRSHPSMMQPQTPSTSATAIQSMTESNATANDSPSKPLIQASAASKIDAEQQLNSLRHELNSSHADRAALLAQLELASEQTQQLQTHHRATEEHHAREIGKLKLEVQNAQSALAAIQSERDAIQRSQNEALEHQRIAIEAECQSRCDALNARLQHTQRLYDALQRDHARQSLDLRQELRTVERLKQELRKAEVRVQDSDRLQTQNGFAAGLGQPIRSQQQPTISPSRSMHQHHSLTGSQFRTPLSASFSSASTQRHSREQSPVSIQRTSSMSMQQKLASLAELSSKLMQEDESTYVD